MQPLQPLCRNDIDALVRYLLTPCPTNRVNYKYQRNLDVLVRVRQVLGDTPISFHQLMENKQNKVFLVSVVRFLEQTQQKETLTLLAIQKNKVKTVVDKKDAKKIMMDALFRGIIVHVHDNKREDTFEFDATKPIGFTGELARAEEYITQNNFQTVADLDRFLRKCENEEYTNKPVLSVANVCTTVPVEVRLTILFFFCWHYSDLFSRRSFASSMLTTEHLNRFISQIGSLFGDF